MEILLTQTHRCIFVDVDVLPRETGQIKKKLKLREKSEKENERKSFHLVKCCLSSINNIRKEMKCDAGNVKETSRAKTAEFFIWMNGADSSMWLKERHEAWMKRKARKTENWKLMTSWCLAKVCQDCCDGEGRQPAESRARSIMKKGFGVKQVWNLLLAFVLYFPTRLRHEREEKRFHFRDYLHHKKLYLFPPFELSPFANSIENISALKYDNLLRQLHNFLIIRMKTSIEDRRSRKFTTHFVEWSGDNGGALKIEIN